jgi:hypothetical protein
MADREPFDLAPLIDLSLRLAQLVIDGDLAAIKLEGLADRDAWLLDAAKQGLDLARLQVTLAAALLIDRKKAPDNVLDIPGSQKLVERAAIRAGGQGRDPGRLVALYRQRPRSLAANLTHGHRRPIGFIGRGKLIAAQTGGLKRGRAKRETDRPAIVKALELLGNPAIIMPVLTPETQVAIIIPGIGSDSHPAPLWHRMSAICSTKLGVKEKPNRR